LKILMPIFLLSPMIKAIIFDVDGTLLDTKEFIFQSFEHVLQTFDLSHLSRRDIDMVMGLPLEECYKALAPNVNVALLRKAHNAFQEDNIQLVELFANTVQTLAALRGKGFKMAVVSTRKQTVLRSLDHAGIAHLLDCIITGDDVKNFKPHPEGIHQALKKLKIPATQAIMVGDTEVDIQAGKNAGTYTAAALYGFGSRESLEINQPDHLLSDISDLLIALGLKSSDQRAYESVLK